MRSERDDFICAVCREPVRSAVAISDPDYARIHGLFTCHGSKDLVSFDEEEIPDLRFFTRSGIDTRIAAYWKIIRHKLRSRWG